MHKQVYASGFLYHSPSQQILLHQSQPDSTLSTPWGMFGGLCHNGENACTAFLRIIKEQINLRLPEEHVLPVYDYLHTMHNTIYYVFYAHVKDLITPPKSDTGVATWFTFKQTTKLTFGDQVRQDLTVLERVIRAQVRVEEEKILAAQPVNSRFAP